MSQRTRIHTGRLEHAPQCAGSCSTARACRATDRSACSSTAPPAPLPRAALSVSTPLSLLRALSQSTDSATHLERNALAVGFERDEVVADFAPADASARGVSQRTRPSDHRAAVTTHRGLYRSLKHSMWYGSLSLIWNFWPPRGSWQPVHVKQSGWYGSPATVRRGPRLQTYASIGTLSVRARVCLWPLRPHALSNT